MKSSKAFGSKIKIRNFKVRFTGTFVLLKYYGLCYMESIQTPYILAKESYVLLKAFKIKKPDFSSKSSLS